LHLCDGRTAVRIKGKRALASRGVFVIYALRFVGSYIPEGGHIGLIGERVEPEDVAGAAEVEKLAESELVGVVVGVAVGAVVEEGVEGVLAGIFYRNVHGLVAIFALLVPAAFESGVGVGGGGDFVGGILRLIMSQHGRVVCIGCVVLWGSATGKKE
jgi:hypothetical protein